MSEPIVFIDWKDLIALYFFGGCISIALIFILYSLAKDFFNNLRNKFRKP